MAPKGTCNLNQPSCVWRSTNSWQGDHWWRVRSQQFHRACWLSWLCLSPSAGWACWPAPWTFSTQGVCALVFSQLEVAGPGVSLVEMWLEEQAGTRDLLPLPSHLIDEQEGVTITCPITHSQSRAEAWMCVPPSKLLTQAPATLQLCILCSS